jgi:chromosome partitioning protein
MRKVAVSLSKGGVGKTTTAVHLAHGLAQQGREVLLVDMDTQGQAGAFLGIKDEVEPRHGLAGIIQRGTDAEDALLQARENLWLLAGGRELAAVRKTIDMKDFGGERTVVEALEPLEGKFDDVVIDTAPGWDSLTVNALFYASEVLIPVSLESATLESLREFLQSLRKVQEYHDELTVSYIVPTFLDGRVKKSEEILEMLEEYFPDKLCPSVRYNVRLSEAAGLGETVFEYDPSSAGATDYKQLTQYITNNGER